MRASRTAPALLLPRPFTCLLVASERLVTIEPALEGDGDLLVLLVARHKPLDAVLEILIDISERRELARHVRIFDRHREQPIVRLGFVLRMLCKASEQTCLDDGKR